MKHGRRLLRWLAVLLLVITVVGVTTVGAAESGLILENMKIYTSEGATDQEKTAAEELQRYLYKITGTMPQIDTTEKTINVGIYVGETVKTKTNAGLTYKDAPADSEAWTIKTDTRNVYLIGGGTRGTLYAVYHLLEDMLGVRWWNMWEEYVPSMTDAVIPTNYSVSGEPAFSYRDIYTAGAESSANSTLFFTRNRMNGFVSKAPVEYGDKITYTSPYHTHTFNHYFKATDFASNPEWFAEIGGVRVNDGQLCMSNDELAEEYAQRIIKNIVSDYAAADSAGKARPKFADVTPNDMGRFCECAACTASTAASGPSGHLLKFVNKIAKIVGEAHPEITIATCAYAQYFEVPLDSTVPASNVMVRLASSDVDILHDIDHPNNAKVKARLDAWSNLLKDGQLYYWDYTVVYDQFCGVLPNMFKFQNDYEYFAQVGGEGVFAEMQRNNTNDFWEMKLWLMTKIMEDPTQDVYDLAQDFTNGYYGAAAGADVYAYLRYMESAAYSYNKAIVFGTDEVINAAWLDGADIVKGNQYFDNAVAETMKDTSITEEERELYLNRLNVARSGLDRVILQNYERFYAEAVQMGITFQLNKQEIGRRLVESFTWRNQVEQDPDSVIDGVNEMGNRYSTDSSAGYMLQRYARYVGELEPDGTMWWPELPQQILADHPDLDERHIYDYPATAFFLKTSLNEDEDPLPKTLVDMGYVSRVAGAGSNGGSALRWNLTGINNYIGSTSNSFVISDTNPLHTNADFKLFLNSPAVEIANGYKLYHIEDTSFYADGRPELQFFGRTVSLSTEGMSYLKDKKVDLYLSMKIEGDPAVGEGIVYIDRLVLVEDCADHTIVTNSQSQVPATCSSNAYAIGPCPICGKEVRAEVEGTKLPHKITGSYTYDASTKTYSAPCDVCGTATYEVECEYPSDLLTYLSKKGIGLEHVRTFDINDFSVNTSNGVVLVDDSETDVGKAAKISNPSNSYIAFSALQYQGKDDSGKDKFISINFGNPASAAKNAYGQKYKVYELDGNTVPAQDINKDYWYTFNWFVQSKVMVRELKDLVGVNVGAYMSLKTVQTKEPNWLGMGAEYDYYFDRVYIVEPCGGCGAGSSTLAVRFNSNGGSYVAEVGVTSGSAVAAPTAPTKEGYVFAGWYLGDVAYDFSKAVTTPLTLTAKWERNVNYVAELNGTNYESLYDAVKAAAEGAVINLLADTDEAVIATVPMTIYRNGYTASGLYVASGLRMTATDSAYIIEIDYPAAFEVTFDNNGVITTVMATTGQPLAEPDEPTRDGYKFLGWFEGDVRYDFTQPVYRTITLTAKWEKDIPGDITISGKTLHTSGLLQIKVFIQYRGIEGFAETKYDKNIIDNGGVLVWTEDTMLADPRDAVHGTEFKDCYIQASGMYEGVYEYFAKQPIPAWEYGKTFYFRPYLKVDGEYAYGDIVEYSVLTYCDKMLKRNDTSEKIMKEKHLLVGLLNYGAVAQKYFNRNMDMLANEKLDEYVSGGYIPEEMLDLNWDDSVLDAIVEPTEDMMVNFAKTGNLACTGRALTVSGAITVKLFMGVGNDPSPFVDAKDATMYFWNKKQYEKLKDAGVPLSKDNATLVQIPHDFVQYVDGTWEYYGYSYGIYASDFGDTIYAAMCVTDSNGVEHCSGVYAYSPEYYAARRLADPASSQKLRDFVQWMVTYGERTKAYKACK